MLRRRAILEGLCFGAALAFTDWLAAGVHRVPLRVVVVVMVAGLSGGLLAGVAGALFRTRGLSAALAAGATLGVQMLAIASRELESSSAAAAQFAAVLTSASFAGLVFAAVRFRVGAGGVLLIAGSVPGASLIWWAAPHGVTGFVACCATPVCFAVTVLVLRSRPRLLLAASASGLAALAVVVAIVEGPSRFEAIESNLRSAPSDSPCVLLVVVDTLGAHYVGGEDLAPPTPTFDRLSREGVRFRQAVSPASWTLPAHASLFTGVWPAEHGAVEGDSRLGDEWPTLAEAFHDAGYETAAFTGGGFVGTASGLQQGFETFDPNAELRFQYFHMHVPLAWRVIKNRWHPVLPVVRWVYERGGMEALDAKVDDWLAQRERERPFFLFVHSYEVHDYFIFHPHVDDGIEALGGRLRLEHEAVAAAAQPELEVFRGLYRRRVEHVDRAVGELLDRVEEAADERGLVVLLTSDHGEGFNERLGRRGHGERLHDDLVHVPMVLRTPERLHAGREVHEIVRLVDVLPTLVELAGFDPPPNISGTSLVPCLLGDAPWPESAWSEHDSADYRSVGLRTLQWKFIVGPEGEEAYELTSDPGERESRLDDVPEELRQRVGAYYAIPVRGAERADYDDDQREQLRRIGYVIEDDDP